jgi:hypothetical protein
MHTSQSTLSAYFALVTPLRDHLAVILREVGDINTSFVLGEPSDAYEKLLDTCIVAVKSVPEQWPTYIPFPPMMNMREVS